MRSNILIAMAVSGAIHVGFAIGGGWWKGKEQAPEAVKSTSPAVEVILPPPEPEPEEPRESTSGPKPNFENCVPTLACVPPAVELAEKVRSLQVDLPADAFGDRQLPLLAAGDGLGIGLRLKGDLVFELDQLDERPVPTFRPKPMFPLEMKRAKIEGEVMVGFIVDRDGNVYGPQVLRSSRHEFESAALEGVLRWKFRPGYEAGRPVSSHVIVPISFSMDG